MPSSSLLRATAALLLTCAFSALAAEPPAAKKPHVRVTISKATTYITEPLRPDGYPDYVAALNQRFSKGVTPENNSAVLFWKAVGPKEIDEKCREKYFKMLGIPPLPEAGDYFIDFDDYIVNPDGAKVVGDENALEKRQQKLWDQQSTAMRRPWSKEEFPMVADWLAANAKPLALLLEASKRPRRYDPYVTNGKTMAAGLLFGPWQTARNSARALAAQAMLRTNEGRPEDAWQDLFACHRLARLIGQGPTLVDALVAITIDGIALEGDRALLEHAKLTSPQILAMRDGLAKLPPMPKMADKIDVCERFLFLDYVATMAREGPSSLWCDLTGNPEFEKRERGALELFADSLATEAIDWDRILRVGNSWCDRQVQATNKPTVAQRRKAIDILNRDIKALAEKAKDMKSLALAMLFNPRQAYSDRFGQAFVALILAGGGACMTAEDRETMQFDLTKLAFALAAYRADHGAYPAKLANLTPRYAAEVPKDIFTDAELHYKPDGKGYLLYSVGQNGKDDGGKNWDDRKNGEDYDDLVVRVPARR